MAATTTQLNPHTVEGGNKIAGDTLATINGGAAPADAVAHYAKLAHGAPGELKDVTPAQPVPTADQNLPALVGALDAPAATSDTANAPTNGLLKRLAQRITTTIDTLGTKVSTVAALGAGGVGVIGWLSQVWDVLQSRLPALSSGRMPVDGSGVTQPVSIAATVPVSGPLTDAQMRATAVPVSIAATVPVSGPLTDAQLRAAAVPVSAASLPLPTNAATSALQAAGNTKLTEIDTAIDAIGAKTPDLGRAAAAASVPHALATEDQATLQSIAGLSIPAHDYVGAARAGTTETFTYRTGGAGGAVVATVTVVTDAAGELVSVARS